MLVVSNLREKAWPGKTLRRRTIQAGGPFGPLLCGTLRFMHLLTLNASVILYTLPEIFYKLVRIAYESCLIFNMHIFIADSITDVTHLPPGESSLIIKS